MPKLKRSDARTIDEAFDMLGGYVLDFSDRTFSEFFEDEFGIDIYNEKYQFNGTSKAKHLRAFIEVEDEYTVAKVIRALWEHRESSPRYADQSSDNNALKTRLFSVISRIEGGGAIARTDALDKFAKDETLEELIAAIERDIGANKPAAALDRLHTYCMKKFSHLLDQKGVTWSKNDPLQSRVGKYVKALEQERDLREITKRIIKSSISIFDQFNEIRNNRSFAHDNDLLDSNEARFIFDSISSLLRFIKTIETSQYGS